MIKRQLKVKLLIVLFLLFSSTVLALDTKESKNLSEKIEQTFKLNNVSTESLPDSTISSYLAYAALNNPGLKAAFYSWKAALEKVGYAGVLPDPMLSYGNYIKNVETRVGPQNQRFSIRQKIPWFGTLGAKKGIAFETAKFAYQKYQSQKLMLFYQVKKAYYDYYYLGRQIQITKDNIELLKFWEEVVQAKYKVAQSNYADVIKTDVELVKLEDKLQSFEERKEPIAARLRATLNISDSVNLTIPHTIAIEEAPVNHDSLLTAALAYNPNLIAIQHLIEKAKTGERLAAKTSFPNFTFGMDYIETGKAIKPNLAESGKDPWIVSVGINLPLWFGKNKAKKNEAKARVKMMQYNLTDSKNKIITAVEKSVYEYDDALRKIKLYRDGLLPKAQQALNATFTAYKAGTMDFLNVLDAQRQLLNFQLKYDYAITNLAIKKAELEMLTGNEITTVLKQ
ncbi:MAG: TolC family protein [FCB group bacterium]|nr:TolC family protein [FCB group bacterium]